MLLLYSRLAPELVTRTVRKREVLEAKVWSKAQSCIANKAVHVKHTLSSSESIWPPPFSTGVYWNEEPPPEGQRDKEIYFSQFISSLFYGVGQLLPGSFAGLLMSRPRLLAAGDSRCQKVPRRFSWSIQGEQWRAAAMTGTFHTIHPTFSILHWDALQFCRENIKWIVRKAAWRGAPLSEA